MSEKGKYYHALGLLAAITAYPDSNFTSNKKEGEISKLLADLYSKVDL